MALKANVSFTLPKGTSVASDVLPHFSKLGYRLIEEKSGEWVFQRGSKSAVWWRFDIRKYDTKLKVKSIVQKDGSIWVSCEWNVYTTSFNITTGSDIATLEAEGHSFESILRGVQQ